MRPSFQISTTRNFWTPTFSFSKASTRSSLATTSATNYNGSTLKTIVEVWPWPCWNIASRHTGSSAFKTFTTMGTQIRSSACTTHWPLWSTLKARAGSNFLMDVSSAVSSVLEVFVAWFHHQTVLVSPSPQASSHEKTLRIFGLTLFAVPHTAM